MDHTRFHIDKSSCIYQLVAITAVSAHSLNLIPNSIPVLVERYRIFLQQKGHKSGKTCDTGSANTACGTSVWHDSRRWSGGRGAVERGRVGGGDHDKVCACQTGGVAAVDDDRLVTKVVWRAGVGGEIELGVACDKRSCGNVSVLASQVTGLACLGCSYLAWVVLAAVGGVEVTKGGGAVAIGWDWEVVDVVDEWTVGGFGWEASEVDGEDDTRATSGRDTGDGTSDGGASQVVKVGCWENGLVGCCWETGLDGGIAAWTGEAWVCRTVVDNGALFSLDTSKRCGSRQDWEDTTHGGGESRWWWRSALTTDKGSTHNWEDDGSVHGC